MLRSFLVSLLALGPSFATTARADQPAQQLYVLAIGYNGLPSAPDPRLRELRYADDDAAAFAQLARDLGARAIVLSSFDADTTRRFPALSEGVRPPVLAELRRTVLELNRAFEQDRQRGVESAVLVTYSGHGVAEAGMAPSLTLADGELTRDTLYSEVLGGLKARFVHLVVDACHAAAVVRPRDAQADIVALSPQEIHSHWSGTTLERLANVGALVASSANAQSHEWDGWQQGVFTHEIVSGLRGAADVNGDLRIEYSEMAAFLSAVNREVGDSAVRVRPLVKAPSAAPRAPILELGARKSLAFIEGRPAQLGRIWIEAEGGQRIADLSSEQEQFVRLLVPSRRLLFVRTAIGEAQVTLPAGGRVQLADLTLRAVAWHSRGSTDLSLHRGLFAAAFGPAYYRGFVDYADDWVAVPLRTVPGTPEMTAARDTQDNLPAILRWTTLGLSGALLVTSAIAGVAMLDAEADFDDAKGLERQSLEASDRHETFGTVALGTLIGGALTGAVSAVLFATE